MDYSIILEVGNIEFRGNHGIDGNSRLALERPLSPGEWYHAVMIIDHTEGLMSAYINGSTEGINIQAGRTRTFPSGRSFGDDDPFRLGSDENNNNAFRGIIDEFAFWERAITEREVQQIYQTGLGGTRLIDSDDAQFSPEPFVVLLFPMFFSSNWFYVYQQNSVNGAYFNTRTKALNGLLYWLAQIIAAVIWGYLLDRENVRRTTRAKGAWVALFVLTFVIWGGGYAFEKTYTRETVVLKRRDQKEPVSYPSEEVKSVLERTMGVPIFQEQVIKLAMVAAGFSKRTFILLKFSIILLNTVLLPETP